MNENNSTWGTIVLKLNFFVRFLGELKINQKNISELTDLYPLPYLYVLDFSKSLFHEIDWPFLFWQGFHIVLKWIWKKNLEKIWKSKYSSNMITKTWIQISRH